MQSRIVLISDDVDFFEYISSKLKLRKNDELFRFAFDAVPGKIHMLSTSMLIINSENSENKTEELLKLVKGIPALVFSYNDNEDFRIKSYNLGALGFITPFTSDEEFSAKFVLGLNLASKITKALQYREMLVENNILKKNNEVFIDYAKILDKELTKLDSTSSKAVLVAISPSDKSKFLIQTNQIESIILGNIRQNDILMNYATSKYFLLLFDTNIDSAKKIWNNIQKQITEPIFAGFANTLGKSRQQLINEVLSRLHEAINYNKEAVVEKKSDNINFKTYRNDFNKKLEQVVTPVLYMTQQKYNDKLFGMKIEQFFKDSAGALKITGHNIGATFSIFGVGFSKVNIDISYETPKKVPAKRITLEPKELEAGFLQDLLEHFIEEFRKEINNDNS